MPINDYKCQCTKEQLSDHYTRNNKEVVYCSCNKPMSKQVGAASLGNMDKLGRTK